MIEIVKLLIQKNKTIATMESCTGGALASEITNVPGSSQVLKFSAVTYCNEYKEKMGVNPQIIEKYSVYSSNTACEMAKCISDFADADYGIGITGKLNEKDINNMQGEDNKVYFCIFNRENNSYYNNELYVTKESRLENKKEVLAKIKEDLLVQLKK